MENQLAIAKNFQPRLKIRKRIRRTPAYNNKYNSRAFPPGSRSQIQCQAGLKFPM